MDPFRTVNDPFGAPGDPMDEVLSLQTYTEDSTDSAITLYCPTKTETCTISCPAKPTAGISGPTLE